VAQERHHCDQFAAEHCQPPSGQRPPTDGCSRDSSEKEDEPVCSHLSSAPVRGFQQRGPQRVGAWPALTQRRSSGCLIAVREPASVMRSDLRGLSQLRRIFVDPHAWEPRFLGWPGCWPPWLSAALAGGCGSLREPMPLPRLSRISPTTPPPPGIGYPLQHPRARAGPAGGGDCSMRGVLLVRQRPAYPPAFPPRPIGVDQKATPRTFQRDSGP